MTDAHGCCASCGTVNTLGAMRVYRGAGDVMRCPTCGNVTVVTVVIRERTRVHLGRPVDRTCRLTCKPSSSAHLAIAPSAFGCGSRRSRGRR
jgi:hypothetical protein